MFAEVGAEKERPFNPKLYVNKEVEELFKKQLAIEQEVSTFIITTFQTLINRGYAFIRFYITSFNTIRTFWKANSRVTKSFSTLKTLSERYIV